MSNATESVRFEEHAEDHLSKALGAYTALFLTRAMSKPSACWRPIDEIVADVLSNVTMRVTVATHTSCQSLEVTSATAREALRLRNSVAQEPAT